MRRFAVLVGAASVIAGCSGSVAPAGTPSATATNASGSPSARPSVAADPWTEDLDQLDREVRAFHPNPFEINPESQAGGVRGALIKLLTPLLLSAQRTEMANLKRLIEARV